MKKKIIGFTGICILALAVTIIANIDKNKKVSFKLNNIEAFASDAEAGLGKKCTGPKSEDSPYNCKCTNDKPCRDNNGC